MSQNDVYPEYTFEDFERMIDEAKRVVLNSDTIEALVGFFETEFADLEKFLIETINVLLTGIQDAEELESIVNGVKAFLDRLYLFRDSKRFREVMFDQDWYAWQLLDEIEDNVPLFDLDIIGRDVFNTFLDVWLQGLLEAGEPLWRMRSIMEEFIYDLEYTAIKLEKFIETGTWAPEDLEKLADRLKALLGMIDDARTYLPEFEDMAKNAAIDALEYLLDLIWKALLP